jgi:hypothetical protein
VGPLAYIFESLQNNRVEMERRQRQHYGGNERNYRYPQARPDGELLRRAQIEASCV